MSRLLPTRAGHAPVRVFARRIDPKTERQLQRLAAQPYVEAEVAAMADAHLAEGVAVGTVFATQTHLVPGALGGDLGCGMSALCFDVEADRLDRSDLTRLLEQLGQRIPVGDAEHRRPVVVPEELRGAWLSTASLNRAKDRLLPRHHGTLGGGNHFLELDRDTTGRLWWVVHTGSRGVGAAIGQHHQKIAGGPLGALEVSTAAGASYLADLQVGLQIAAANRAACLAQAAELLAELVGRGPDPESRIDLFHNFVAAEHHRGRQLYVHRKGATPAPAGGLGLIPGSMGTATYVVRGKGSELSWGSASHGAGRVMSRGEARRRVSPRALVQRMRGVVYDGSKLESLVDEAPQAYRDLREVLEDQADLVEPVLRLEPLLVLKG